MKHLRPITALLIFCLPIWFIEIISAGTLLTLLCLFLQPAVVIATPLPAPAYQPAQLQTSPTPVSQAQSSQATIYISPEEASSRAIVDTQDDLWRATVQAAQSCSNFQVGLLSESTNVACGATRTGDCINPTHFSDGQVISFTLRNLTANGPLLGNPDSWLSGQGDGCAAGGTDLQDGAPRPTNLAGCYYNDASGFRGDNQSPNAVLFTFQEPVTAFGAWFGDLETKAAGTTYYHAGADGGSGAGGALAYLRLFFEDGTVQQAPITPTLAPVTTWLSTTAPPPIAPVGSGGDVGLCGGANDPTDADGCGNETTRWVGFVSDSPNNRVKQLLVVVGDDDHSGSGPSNGPNVQCSGGSANSCNAGTEFLSFIGPTLCLAPDLTISKTGQPDPVVAGGIVTYTLRYHNLIPDNTTGMITLTDTLPPGVTYLTTLAANPPATLLNSTPQWQVAALPANTTGYLTFTARIGTGVAGPITNTATSVTSGEHNLSNNQAQHRLQVVPILGQLVVNKVVVNDHGGTAQARDFPLWLNGQPITSGVTITLPAGIYTVTESNQQGYIGSFSGDCAADGVIQITAGAQQRCTLTNNDPPPTLGVLTVQKIVINDDGGTAQVSDFPLWVNQQAVNSGVENLLAPGSYQVSEQNRPGYHLTYGGDCADTGLVSLNAGEHKVCTLTNDDLAPTLTVHKVVQNDDGGTAQVSDFPLWVGELAVTSGVTVTLPSAAYRVHEQNQPGYAATISGDCAADGSIQLALGERKQCTITNDDLPPALATLTVNKIVRNEYGGTAQVADFPLFVSGQPVLSGVDQLLPPGSYLITETNQAGYSATYSGDCAADGAITLNAGEHKVCTLTNADQAATLTVHKVVVNDNSGTAQASAFPLWVNHTRVSSGVANLLTAGAYTVSESNLPGYAATISGDCAAAGRVTLQLGEAKTCTITNNDLPPTLGSLTVQKVVFNDDGGTAQVADFALLVNGQPVLSGATNLLAPGLYTVSEVNQPGYAATFSGDCTATGQVVLAAGEHKQCLITNADLAPTLTVHKVVNNHHGGLASALDFPLFVDSQRVSNGVTITLAAGSYRVQENDLLGYVGQISGDCAADGRITLQIGEAKTCLVTNSDLPPTLGSLTVRKRVINDDGGQAQISDFPLAVNGQPVVSDVETTLPPGSYQVSERNLPGYQAHFGGDCSPSGLVTVVANRAQVCLITNDDQPPTLTVEKVVSNDDGGTATVADFPLFVNQQLVQSGVTTTLAAGVYRVSERSLPGYRASFSAACATDGRVSLALGATQRCLITNDDQFASLGDRVWYDHDLDGQQGAEEPGIAGLTVHLYDSQGNLRSTTVTGPAGDYLFAGLLPGDYRVAFDKPADFVFTAPGQGPTGSDSDVNPDSGRTALLTLAASEHRQDIDAGLYQLAALGNFVWNDLNANGVQEANEPGLSGIRVTLYDAAHTIVGITHSNQQGFYGFTDLPPGDYTVKFELPPEYRFTLADQGADAADSDVNPTTGETASFHLAPDETNLTMKAGVLAYPLLSLTKRVNATRLEIPTAATALLTYTLSYSNSGPAPATGVVLTETVPPATTFVAAASSPGWQCADGAPAGTVCVLAVGALPAFSHGQALFALALRPPLTNNLIVNNQAALGDNGANSAQGTRQGPREASVRTDIYTPTGLAESSEPGFNDAQRLYLPLVQKEPATVEP